MMVPELLTLDASKGAVSELLVSHPMVDYAERETTAWYPQDANRNHPLAPRPKLKLLCADACEFVAVYTRRKTMERHLFRSQTSQMYRSAAAALNS
jgi:hypothetical protein